MRRWRIVVIDDNPEGSLEAVLLSPLVVAEPLVSSASEEQIADVVKENLLNPYLPLEPGQLYANEADVDFQVRDFEERRAECAPRYPIIEVERDFARAWKLVGQLAQTPPDILFLDVMFDIKTTPPEDVEGIIEELLRSERIAPIGRPTVIEVLSRGGLFLLGKLLRSRGQVRNMPLIVLYSASRDVQADFRPFEYASDGRFEVVEKSVLRNDAEKRKQVFRRRIRDYFMDGTVRPDEVRAAVNILASPEAIAGDGDAWTSAFSHPIGSDWCFGAMFVAESVAYIASSPSRRPAVIADLEKFIAPLVSDARSFVDMMESSPARLFSHVGRVTYAKRPSWLDVESSTEQNGNGHVLISLNELNLVNIRQELVAAVQRLPESLRNALGATLENIVNPQPDETLSNGSAIRRRSGRKLDTFVKSLIGHDRHWEELLNQCRMRMPAADISARIAAEVKGPLQLQMDSDGVKWDFEQKLELCLSPSRCSVKEPLASLLSAIVNNMRRHAYAGGAGPIYVRYSRQDMPATFEIELRDEGLGFPDLRYYDPRGRGGDLSTALLAAADWFEVEVHSGGIKCRPAMRGSGEPESSAIERGTAFVIRVPAYRLQDEA